MLNAVGVASVEDLFQDIPESFRNPKLNLPSPLSELELHQELSDISSSNCDLEEYGCFLGAGAYKHFIPSIVKAIVSRGEFLTSYTPYQAEVSQGTLQAAYEFQTMTCNLLAMDVANAGMYDGATSLAEAALMACRVTGRDRVVLLNTVSPTYREVIETYTGSQNIDLSVINSSEGEELGDDTACLIVQYPNFFGYLEDLIVLERLVHAKGALLVVSAGPIACGMLRPPGEYGADIVTGEGQSLGIDLSFGGPYLGLFATRERLMRQMPGRVVGRTVDSRGETGYVLTMQTREQHIRRERATSNICTSQQLLALSAAVYMAALGKNGFAQVSQLCYQKAHYTSSILSRLSGFSLPLPQTFFNEFVLRCPVSPTEINKRLLEFGIVGGLDISEHIPRGMMICVTEINTRQEIDTLAKVFSEFAE